jgi:cytochrome c-type biogenesis protein CcmH
MIRAMAEAASRRAGTIALIAAGLIASAAIGIALLRPGEGEASGAPESAAANAQQAASVEAMIPDLVQRLRADPDNDQGWYNLGMLYREARRFAESEQAFRRAMELRPENPDYAAYSGEALLLLGGRTPPAEAETLFRRALQLQPGNPQALYYLATLRDIRGDHEGALDELIALLRSAPADAPWEPQVRQAAETIARDNRIDISGRLPPPRPRPPGPGSPDDVATAAIPGPSREQIDAARALPPSQQDEMARGMVDRLAARLRSNPRDPEGWTMLMRSRMMLGEREAAAEALRSGLAAFPADAAARERLRAAAATLGVPAG